MLLRNFKQIPSSLISKAKPAASHIPPEPREIAGPPERWPRVFFNADSLAYLIEVYVKL